MQYAPYMLIKMAPLLVASRVVPVYTAPPQQALTVLHTLPEVCSTPGYARRIVGLPYSWLLLLLCCKQATRHAEFEAIDRILADHGGDVEKVQFHRYSSCHVSHSGLPGPT